MAQAFDFKADLPTGDIDLGGRNYVRVYGYSDISPPLVEMRIVHRGDPITLHLHPEQGEHIAEALLSAVTKARSGS